MKPNTQGVRLCKRCAMHPATPMGYCKQCIKEVLKERAELTKPK